MCSPKDQRGMSPHSSTWRPVEQGAAREACDYQPGTDFSRFGKADRDERSCENKHILSAGTRCHVRPLKTVSRRVRCHVMCVL
jgi:hypothetical protein